MTAPFRLRCLRLNWECRQALALPLLPEPQLTAWLLRHLPAAVHDDRARGFWVRVPRSSQVDFLPGDPFVFELVLHDHAPVIARVAELLAVWTATTSRPDATPSFDPAMPLQTHLRWTGLQCGWTAQPIAEPAHSTAFGLDELLASAAASALRRAPLWRWQWRSPARLLKRGPGRPREGEDRFIRDEAAVDPTLLWRRLVATLNALDAADRVALPPCDPAQPPDVQLPAQELFWVDAHYRSGPGQRNPSGGLLGESLLAWSQPPAEATLGLLLLGGWLGIGQRRGFGLGQYQLLPAEERLPSAPTSVLRRLTEPLRWQQAHAHVTANAEAAPDRAEGSVPDFDPDRVTRIATQLCAGPGRYTVPPLHPVALPKPGGGFRQLLVPPFWDRVAQRVVLEAIAAPLHALESDASHGFRAGRSRQGARDRLLALAASGHDWVLESDVDDFFDSVDPWRIRVRLRALFGADPLVELILDWICAPVRHPDGRLEGRRRGLPQGSPLSPLLANLLLADLDTDLTAAGHALVRYADDFVVACRSRAQAEAALELATASLAEKGLRLKPEKTRITRFADGFDFLGWRFVGSLALPIARADRLPPNPNAHLQQRLAAAPAAAREADAALASWEPAPFEPVTVEDRATPEPPAARDIPPGAGTLGEYLVLAGPPHRLRREQGAWVVWPAGAASSAPPGTTPLLRRAGEQLAGILLAGVQHIATGALHYALEIGTPVHFIGSNGRYRGTLWPQGAGADTTLWLDQQRCFADPAHALAIARELVSARIAGQRAVLRNRDHPALERAGPGLLRAVLAADSVATLRGLEGQAAAVYFNALRELLDPAWGFDGRERRPPRDAFNVLLSYGYAILTSIAQTWVHVVGLCPSSAPFHVAHGQRPALALDLIEPLRHRVEAVALNQLRRRERQATDFSARPGGGLQMDALARRDYTARLLDALGRTGSQVVPDETTLTGTFSADAWFRQSLWSLIAVIRGQQTGWRVTRPRTGS